MLKVRINIKLFIVFFLFLLCSCKPIITFEYLEITCSINDKYDYYFGESIQINFSILPDKNDFERKFRFFEDKNTASVNFNWDGSTVFIQPILSWQKGQFYSLDLQGTLKMADGRIYSTSVYRSFIYGEPENSFDLLSHEFNESTFIIQFSKPVSIISFEEGFSITPFADYHSEFLDDGSTVIIRPKNGWFINTTYLWTIRNMVSTDGYLMRKNYSGRINGIKDIIQPSIEYICPVDYNVSGSFWHQVHSLDNHLLDNQAIGFSFSKPMDEASVISGVNFSPSINGYFIKETESRFIFIPTSLYQLRREYRLTIADSVKDTSGLTLFEPMQILFTTANQFLQITSITFDDNINPMPTDGTISEYTMISQMSIQLKTVINFSTVIPQKNWNDTVNAISMNVLFPASANSPALLSAYWSYNGSVLSIEWSGFSVSSGDIKNHYILRVDSNQNSVRNQANEYLEEDVCVIFIAL